MKKSQTATRAKAPKAKVKDLSPRNSAKVKGGARSDIGAKLQMQLNEANSLYNRS